MAHYHIETELVKRLAARDVRDDIRNFMVDKIKSDPEWLKPGQPRLDPSVDIPDIGRPKGPYPKTIKEIYNTIDFFKSKIEENKRYMANTTDESKIQKCKQNIAEAEGLIKDFQFDIQYKLRDQTTTEGPEETYTNVMRGPYPQPRTSTK